jgi:hypothetical protein
MDQEVAEIALPYPERNQAQHSLENNVYINHIPIVLANKRESLSKTKPDKMY